MTSLLLHNGTVLTHDREGHVVPLRNTDILIEGKLIAKIGNSLAVPTDCTTIDCSDKIISPGFIDTHHHVWQTQLKGRHANDTLLDYMTSGFFQSYNYSPTDVYWGELAGCLEAIDAGTTTLLDHSHIAYSEQHVHNALSATVDSGIRSIFGYASTPILQQWSSDWTIGTDKLPTWWLELLEKLAKDQPFGDGRVQLGLAFDAYYLPKETVLSIFKMVRGLNLKVITSHYVKGPVSGKSSLVDLLDDYALLGSDMVLSHCTGASDEDCRKIKSHGAFVSTTPELEAQMSHGEPMTFHPQLRNSTSFGIDCHSALSSDIVGQMRFSLQHTRAVLNRPIAENLQHPKQLGVTTEEVFNIGTIQAARALGMENQIGQLAEGMLADITIFNTRSPSMVCASDQDPVAAIVLHSSIRDIEMVIIDGNIRKARNVLEPTQVTEALIGLQGKTIEWKDVAAQLLRSRKAIQQRIEKLDQAAGSRETYKIFHIDESDII